MTQNSILKYFSDLRLCRVQMFKLYTSKVHREFKHLWQRPKQGRLHYTDDKWHDKVIVGRDPLERFMKYLSSDANLSKQYTNHCIRHTVMDNLEEHGFEARHIMGLSGHKSESSVKKYAKRVSTKKKREMADTLATTMKTKHAKLETVTNPVPLLNLTNTIDTNQNQNDNALLNIDLTNANLEPIPYEPNDDMLVKFLDNFELTQPTNTTTTNCERLKSQIE